MGALRVTHSASSATWPCLAPPPTPPPAGGALHRCAHALRRVRPRARLGRLSASLPRGGSLLLPRLGEGRDGGSPRYAFRVFGHLAVPPPTPALPQRGREPMRLSPPWRR